MAPARKKVVESEVYPRVYGGTGVSIPNARQIVGLSPRVRGNHFLAAQLSM